MFECRTFITVKEIGVVNVYELPSAFSRYLYMTNDIKQVKK